MHNVVPEEEATEGIAAGPYAVMVAELQREVSSVLLTMT